MKIAIVVVAYNRVDSISRLLKSINNAIYPEAAHLIISIDKSNTESVVNYANNFSFSHGTKEIITHEKNLGLRKHILGCGDLLEVYDALIVLEDDLVVSPSFYLYAHKAALYYQNNDNIAGISLYSYHVNPHTTSPFFPEMRNKENYFVQWAPSWGQVWLKRQWFDFKKWYKENNEEFADASHLPYNICHWGKKSWLKYHIKYAIENNKFFVHPYIAYSTTCGDQGEHTSENTSYFQVCLQNSIKNSFDFAPFDSKAVKYDSFFERYGLLLEYNDLCIDLNGAKKNQTKNRYWLTTRAYKYRIVKSYRLTFKPIERNINDENIGEDIFLYDTFTKTNTAPEYQRSSLLFQYDIQNLLKIILNYGVKNIIKDCAHSTKKRINRKINRLFK